MVRNNNVIKDTVVMVPPRLLAGATVLYWGAMVGMPIIALLMAVLLEARSWVSYRWDISEKGYVKAFYVSLFFIAIALVLIRLGDVDYHSFSKMIKWSPIFALPIELAQRYGKSDKMLLNTFFYFSRLRMIRDRKEGRKSEPNVINTGYPYIIGVLICSTCMDRQDWLVYVGMIGIMLAVVYFTVSARGVRWQRLICLFPIVIIATLAAMAVVNENYDEVVKIRTGSGKHLTKNFHDPTRSRLGSLGDVKLNSEIEWRLWAEGTPPKYLHTGVYNKFQSTRWKYDYEIAGYDTLSDAFDSRTGIRLPQEGKNHYVFNNESLAALQKTENINNVEVISIRGVGDTLTTESVIPAVIGFKTVANLATTDTIPAMTPLGVAKLVDRKEILDYELWKTDAVGDLMDKPNLQLDTHVDGEQQRIVDILIDEIKLESYATVEEKIAAIRRLFISKFTYSLHFESAQFRFRGSDLEKFMLYERMGHCEYFATTAALMLRRVGVPTRYTVGYVVREQDDDQWLIRGTHGHAWCMVWMNDGWQNIDLTPPDWYTVQNVDKGLGFWHGLKDWFQRTREDFQAWRSQPANAELFRRGLVVLGVLFLVWFGFRIWRKRLIANNKTDELNYENYNYSPEVKQLMQEWAKEHGRRSSGQSLRSWIKQHRSAQSDINKKDLDEVIQRHELARFSNS